MATTDTLLVDGVSSPIKPSNGMKMLSPTSVDLASVDLPAEITLNEREMCDLEMLLSGALAPVTGYMTEPDYLSVLDKMRLASGELFPLPIVLAISKQSVTPVAASSMNTVATTPEVENNADTNGVIRTSAVHTLKLKDKVGVIVAEVFVKDLYVPDIRMEKVKVLGCDDDNHPYSPVLDSFKDCYYVGGKVEKVHPILHFDFQQFRLGPCVIQSYVKEHGWEAVVAFQTRNPMHRSHFELTRQALREVEKKTGKKAMLLLSPVVGPTQPGDVEYHVRVRCYEKILKQYGDDKVKLVLLPVAMRMAGPREAVWHAIIRRNYGCTHFIVGRDHAGPSAKRQDGSTFYGLYDAHDLLKSIQGELGVEPVFARSMLYVGEEHGYVQEDLVPSGVAAQNISGSAFRQMLETRQPIPKWFSFPEVAEELQRFYRPNYERGFCVYFTGLPCSGKSTLAVSLESSLLDSALETRRVTVLDADIIRTHLSKGLGFSRADRSLNVRRIGYVASEIVKHGGICLVANIAPYEDDRTFNRELITSSGGGYIEVYVSTPLEICEQRDIKELYRKARLGVIKQFTGISDPYEVPATPNLVVNSSTDICAKVNEVKDFLRKGHWIR